MADNLYEITFYTSDKDLAGTDSDLHLRMFGLLQGPHPDGGTGEIWLNPRLSGNAFESDSTDTLTLTSDDVSDVGPIEKIELIHLGGDANPDWHLNRVEIKYKPAQVQTHQDKATFYFKRWITKGSTEQTRNPALKPPVVIAAADPTITTDRVSYEVVDNTDGTTEVTLNFGGSHTLTQEAEKDLNEEQSNATTIKTGFGLEVENKYKLMLKTESAFASAISTHLSSQSKLEKSLLYSTTATVPPGMMLIYRCAMVKTTQSGSVTLDTGEGYRLEVPFKNLVKIETQYKTYGPFSKDDVINERYLTDLPSDCRTLFEAIKSQEVSRG